MIDDNNGPLMFIETYKDEIKAEKISKYDSRKVKHNNVINSNLNIDNIKIYKYQDRLIIPYKTDSKLIYGIIICNVEGNIVSNTTIDLNESAKFEEFKL